MSKRTNSIAVSTIGIDTGKNTLHMIGLDEKGVIILREKVSSTTLADIFTPQLRVDPGSAVRTSPRA